MVIEEEFSIEIFDKDVDVIYFGMLFNYCFISFIS